MGKKNGMPTTQGGTSPLPFPQDQMRLQILSIFKELKEAGVFNQAPPPPPPPPPTVNSTMTVGELIAIINNQ